MTREMGSEEEKQIKVPLANSIITHEEEDGNIRVFDEIKKQLWLAGPLICVSLLQYSLNLISIMFVGHLGELSLSGASMATSFATVTGFSLFVSTCTFSTKYDTFYSQAIYLKFIIFFNRWVWQVL